MDKGAPSVAPSAHANHAVASGQVSFPLIRGCLVINFSLINRDTGDYGVGEHGDRHGMGDWQWWTMETSMAMGINRQW